MGKLANPNMLMLDRVDDILGVLLDHYGLQIDFRIEKDGKTVLCGDFLEQLREDLRSLNMELARAERYVVATSEAYSLYKPHIISDEGESIDVGEWMREAFIDGYMADK